MTPVGSFKVLRESCEIEGITLMRGSEIILTEDAADEHVKRGDIALTRWLDPKNDWDRAFIESAEAKADREAKEDEESPRATAPEGITQAHMTHEAREQLEDRRDEVEADDAKARAEEKKVRKNDEGKPKSK